MTFTFSLLRCRISVVFQVRSAQRVRISDADLIKRLLLIVFVFAICLMIRMLVAQPRAVTGKPN